jgi:DNA-binding CsgD family transcriptional regulator
MSAPNVRANPNLRLLGDEPPALTGRHDEIEACRRAIDGSTRLLYVHGETGIGKTALAEVCADVCRRADRSHRWAPNLDEARQLHQEGAAEVVILDQSAGDPPCGDSELLSHVARLGPTRTLAVFTRHAPGMTLRVRAARGDVEVIALRRLCDLDAAEVLGDLGVPITMARELAARCRGIPLLLMAVAAVALHAKPGSDVDEIWTEALELVASDVPVMCPDEVALLTAACFAERVPLPELSASSSSLEPLDRLTGRDFVRRCGLSVSVDCAIRLAVLGSACLSTPADVEAEPPPDDRDACLDTALWQRMHVVAEQVKLSPREVEVLELLLLGRNSKEIGVALDISARTARFHQSNLLAKMGADSRLDLVRALLAPLSTAPVG